MALGAPIFRGFLSTSDEHFCCCYCCQTVNIGNQSFFVFMLKISPSSCRAVNCKCQVKRTYLTITCFQEEQILAARVELTPKARAEKLGDADVQGRAKKIPAKFSDTCSARADGLCIGCLGQWAERWRDNSNMQEFFRTTL